MLASCGSGAPKLEQSAIARVEASAAWDPFGENISIAPLVSALETVDAVRLGTRSIVALDKYNRRDEAVQSALSIESDGASLTISLKHCLPAVSLYLRMDPAVEHFAAASFRDGLLGLALEPEAGLIAIGIVGLGQGAVLPAGTVLATISFAPGPATQLRTSSKVSQDSRSEVRNLSAIDNGAEGATLQWSERNTGDYDLNGEVNIADLTPIGANFSASYTTESADFATLEVVDGDENFVITIAELTPIGQNFGCFISGYNIYRTELSAPDEIPLAADTERWTKVLNSEGGIDPAAARQFNNQDFRLVYTFQDESGEGDFGWYVRAVGKPADSPLEGPPGNVITATVEPEGPPPAGLGFEIQGPATENVAVDDEFYLAIRVNDVTGLFSANVRFEYDASIVELLESVPAYTDHDNFLVPPLFLAVDDVDAATDPYVLLGFNATQTQGELAKDGSGVLGYFRFKAIAAGNVAEAFRFPESSNFILLWGEQYGVPIANPALGPPQLLNVSP